MPSLRASSAAAAAAAAALLAVLCSPPAADAHARLLRSDPAAGSVLASSPTVVSLTFSEPPELRFTRIVIVTGTGDTISLARPQRVAGSTVSASLLGLLPAGAYTVVWRTAAADGHPAHGHVAFIVGAAFAGSAAIGVAATPPGGRAAAPDPGRARLMPRRALDHEFLEGVGVGTVVIRWLEFVGLVMLIGCVTFRIAVLGRVAWGAEGLADGGGGREQIDRRARRVGLGTGATLLVALLLRLIGEMRDLDAAGAAGAAGAGTMAVAIADALIHSAWGRGWLLGVVALLAVLGAFAAGPSWGARTAAAVGAVALAAEPGLTGHAVASPGPAVAVTIDTIHVLAAGSWLGSLFVLAAVAIPNALRDRRHAGALVKALAAPFHSLSLACVALLLASGVGSAALRLHALSDLPRTDYGRMLLTKLALLSLVLLTGAYNWLRVLPTLGGEAGARSLRRTGAIELAIGAAVLAATAVLVSLATPMAR